MGPICGLQFFLLITRTPTWLRISAACVILLTAFGYVRGYVRRLVLSPEGAALRMLFSRRTIQWHRVRSVGRYVPGGGLGATPYVYISVHERLPEGKWEINDETLQVQDQPGLLEAIEFWQDAAKET